MEKKDEEKQESIPTQKQITMDEGVAKGEMIMTWAVVLFVVALISLGILGVVVIVSGWTEGLIITIAGVFSAFTAYLFISALGMFIKKISLIEQHLNKDDKKKSE